MIIGMPVYHGVDLLDVAGPHEILKWMSIPVEVELVAKEAGDICTRDGFVFKAGKSFHNASKFDVLWVPGGAPEALNAQMKDDSGYLKFLRSQGNARYICSVCEGGVLLAALAHRADVARVAL